MRSIKEIYFHDEAKTIWSSLIYKTSARHECNTSETRVTLVWHKCNRSATRTTRVRHECYTNDMCAIRVKKIDFDKSTSKNIFSHPYIYYIENEKLLGEEQFHSKNQLLEMPCSQAKMCLKSVPQKLFNGKSYIKKLYTRL